MSGRVFPYPSEIYLWVTPEAFYPARPLVLRGTIMAESWQEAVEIARKEGKEQVYHDFDKNTYGTCRNTERPGHFSIGCYIEHRCICMPASLGPEELARKEKEFLSENPDWLTS
jgi:hypothetical protein